MSSRQLSFGSAKLTSVVAHRGRRPILAARVLERSPREPIRFIDLVVVPPRAGIGLHTHGLDDEELYIVIDGAALVTMDGQVSRVSAGDVLVNRPGGSHGLENDGDLPLRMVVVCAAANRRDADDPL